MHQRRPVDLFLSYFYNSHFDPAGFDELHQLGIPSVNFYCNSAFSSARWLRLRRRWTSVGTRNAMRAHSISRWAPNRSGYSWAPIQRFIIRGRASRGSRRLVSSVKGMPIGVSSVGLSTTLIKAGVPVDIYGSGWGADEILSVEPGAPEVVYLGRRRSTPGRMASYFERIRSEITSNGPIRGTVRLSRQAAYRRETRRLGPSLQPRAKGRAGDLSDGDECLRTRFKL